MFASSAGWRRTGARGRMRSLRDNLAEGRAKRALNAPVAQWSTVLHGEPKSGGLSNRRSGVRFSPGA